MSAIDVPIGEEQDVHIDDARPPTPRRRPPSVALDQLGRPQQITGTARPLDLDDLVEEARLVGHAPRRGFYDAALTQDARTALTQPPAGGAQVASTPSEV